MEQMNWTEIILGVFTLLSTCGWLAIAFLGRDSAMSESKLSALLSLLPRFVSGRKHRQEVEGLKADNRQKDLDLSKDYVTEWRTYIAEPLQREVGEKAGA